MANQIRQHQRNRYIIFIFSATHLRFLARLFRVIELVQEAIICGIPITKRSVVCSLVFLANYYLNVIVSEIFYRDVTLFRNQSVVNKVSFNILAFIPMSIKRSWWSSLPIRLRYPGSLWMWSVLNSFPCGSMKYFHIESLSERSFLWIWSQDRLEQRWNYSRLRFRSRWSQRYRGVSTNTCYRDSWYRLLKK